MDKNNVISFEKRTFGKGPLTEFDSRRCSQTGCLCDGCGSQRVLVNYDGDHTEKWFRNWERRFNTATHFHRVERCMFEPTRASNPALMPIQSTA